MSCVGVCPPKKGKYTMPQCCHYKAPCWKLITLIYITFDQMHQLFQKTLYKSHNCFAFHNFIILCAPPMAKYSKIYLRNKKESNISTPLRYSFLTSVFVDQMSVKNAALKWKIHYSSAKIIARLARRANLQNIFKQNKKPTVLCTWKELTPDKKLCTSGACQKQGSVSESTESFAPQNVTLLFPKKIEVISRIGWNYMSELSSQAHS